MRRRLAILIVLPVALAALAYLRDPPWAGRIASGFGGWEVGPSGTPFRWTGGRASFFVPSDGAGLEIPFRALFLTSDTTPFIVDIAVDDRRVTQVRLADEAWQRVEVPMPRPRSGRRFRRVDLRISRTWSERSLGVQVGEVAVVR